jgi:uncharacterized phage protein gp47/JayE
MDVTSLVWIDSAGYHYADFPSFLAYLTTSYQNIYGADVYLGSDSQDGQWLGVVSQALYDTAALGASIYNSFSPSTAQGVGLSRNVKINGLRRQSATNSTVELVIVGTANTSLINCSAIDTLNQIWNLPASVTIPDSGTITVTATSAAPGAIQAFADTITGINTPTQGWQTVNNPGAAIAGQAYESDAALRNRQAISTSIPAQTIFDATIGAVGNVAGVTALSPYENDTGTTDANGLPPHGISLVVAGGDDTDIAQTILDYKTPGTQTYGTTSVPLTDPKGVPITINFFRPTLEPIAVQVTLTPLAGWVSSNQDIIAAAVAAYISSVPIGGTIVITQVIVAAYVPTSTAAGTFTIESVELAGCATGTITLTSNPANLDTVTVNGLLITFVTGTPSGNQVEIGTTNLLTAAALQAFLAASSSADLTPANYSVATDVVTVTYNTPGPTGDTFTLAKSSSAITLSGATLGGGAFGTSDIELLFNVLATCLAGNVSFIT